MNCFILAAVLFPMLGGAACYGLGLRNKTGRDFLAMGVSACVLIFALLARDSLTIPGVLGLGLYFQVTPVQKVLSVLTAFIWVSSELFSRDYLAHAHGRNRYHLFSLITLGATEGVFLSGDLFTTFVFFEIMSFTSYVAVKQTQDAKAIRAGQTYLAIAVGCGMATLTGLFMLHSAIGTLRFDAMFDAAAAFGGDRRLIFASAVLILIGFGAKAGMFPVHVWLPDTHPAAPAPFSAILSCILTKTGVFGVLVVSCKLMRFDPDWGMLVLILGTITMFLGAALALLSVDLKRTLACSSLSQIGFILVGIGMQNLLGPHGTLAQDGVIAHMVNHSCIKLTLFTVAGVIVMNTEKLNLNELRGYGRGKPFLAVTFLLAALGVSGIPGFGGYISKTLLHESIVEYGAVPFIEWVFIVSGGFTLAYMTKLFVCIFVEHGDGEESKGTKYLTPRAAVVLAISALIMPVFGLMPAATLGKIGAISQPFMGGHGVANGVHYFSAANLLGGFKSIAIGIALYILVVRLLLIRDGKCIDPRPRWLSLENGVYRPLVTKLLPGVGLVLARIPNGLADGCVALMKACVFNQDGTTVEPKENGYFGKYSDEPFLRRGFTDTLAFSFLLLGACLVGALIYIVCHSI